MAADHALALLLEPGHAVLRLYQWTPATVSFGRNQPACGRYDEAAAREAGLAFVRRPTGGRAVLHDRELTYAVVVHAKELGGPRAAYRVIHEALGEGLRGLGIDALLCVPGGATPRPDTRPCFGDPAPGEIHVGGHKLVGSAQARFGGVLLQHGSILTVNDQRLLTILAPERDTAPGLNAKVRGRRPGLTLAALGVDVSLDDLADQIESGFARALDARFVRGEWTETERSRATLLRARYSGPAWTWRL